MVKSRLLRNVLTCSAALAAFSVACTGGDAGSGAGDTGAGAAVDAGYLMLAKEYIAKVTAVRRPVRRHKARK